MNIMLYCKGTDKKIKRRFDMLTKNKESSIILVLMAVVIGALVVEVVKKSSFLDILYLGFIISCFIRFIYIKRH